MTPEQFNRAKPFIDALKPIEDMIQNIGKSQPQILITYGGSSLNLLSFDSPDSNRSLIAEVLEELKRREKSLLKQIE